MSTRARLVALIVVAALLAGGTAAYLLRARADREQALRSAPTQATVPIDAVARQPHIVFRNTAIGPDYGRVAMVPLSAPSGPRAMTTTICDRVFASGGRTLCLATDPTIVSNHTAKAWADDGGEPVDLPLTGVPSRARLSRDGRLAATTSFVAGDSYAATSFSTRTVITTLPEGVSVDLETFRLIHQGKAIAPSDRNFWGVTFAPDDDTFYATVKFGSSTWLARGQLSTHTLTTLRSDAECPSLSPDGTRVAYKKRGTRPAGDWRLAVLDLATGQETMLAESRSVDDQLEWLDDHSVLYGLPGIGTHTAETNVWVVPADGTGSPRLLIEKAWSPAVVR